MKPAEEPCVSGSAHKFLLFSKPNEAPVKTKPLLTYNLNGAGLRMTRVDQIVHLPREDGRGDRCGGRSACVPVPLAYRFRLRLRFGVCD